jgi:formylglycine-generating enzyme required for sulfatase activity
MCAFLNSERAREYDRETLYLSQDIKSWPSAIVRDTKGKYIPRQGAEASPANQVTWKGAVLFCQWYSEQTGKQYRLPSEAEWELAARGTEARRWPWGDVEPTSKHGERYSADKSIVLPLTKVGSHPANATKDKVFDFLAYQNDEWCANLFFRHPTAEQATDTRANLDDLTSKRVTRGYVARDYPRGPRILRATEYGFGRHKGRPWTRVGFDDKMAGSDLHGFRIVEAQPNRVPN